MFQNINWRQGLSLARFRIPRVAPGAKRAVLDATELTMLLDEIDLSRVKRPTLPGAEAARQERCSKAEASCSSQALIPETPAQTAPHSAATLRCTANAEEPA
jgi:hypothetical protein